MVNNTKDQIEKDLGEIRKRAVEYIKDEIAQLCLLNEWTSYEHTGFYTIIYDGKEFGYNMGIEDLFDWYWDNFGQVEHFPDCKWEKGKWR